MRLIAGLAVGAGLLTLAGLWAAGFFETLIWWASSQQHDLQSALAASIQKLRSGEPSAFWSLILLCLGYGFLHAVGPGHGKVLISGAAIGSRGTAVRMGLIAVAGSLAQAVVAIVIVYGGAALFQATARGTLALSESWFQPFGNLLIAGVGGMILWRGLSAIRPVRGAPHAHDHHCGHDHGPTAEQAAEATSAWATLALVAAMAARPCAGALVVLVLAWRFGLPMAGIAAVLAMGLGTAAFTVLIAVLSVLGREATLFSAGGSGTAERLLPGLRILAGGTILLVSLVLLIGSLPGTGRL